MNQSSEKECCIKCKRDIIDGETYEYCLNANCKCHTPQETINEGFKDWNKQANELSETHEIEMSVPQETTYVESIKKYQKILKMIDDMNANGEFRDYSSYSRLRDAISGIILALKQ